MKTVNVEDNTWKTLQELKLKWGMPTLDTVIVSLISEKKSKNDDSISSVQLDKKDGKE